MRHPAPMPDGLPLHLDDVPTERWEIGELAATRRRLGATAGAKRLGVALTRIDPGKRSTPPHSHADEDELFLVLEGSGLSWQSSGSSDVRTYAIGVDDMLWHPSNGDAHTLIAGDEGLTVLAVAEGSRSNITVAAALPQVVRVRPLPGPVVELAPGETVLGGARIRKQRRRRVGLAWDRPGQELVLRPEGLLCSPHHC